MMRPKPEETSLNLRPENPRGAPCNLHYMVYCRVPQPELPCRNTPQPENWSACLLHRQKSTGVPGYTNSTNHLFTLYLKN